MATTQAIAILENSSRFPDRPFFLAVGMVRPHVPSIAPKRLFDLYPEDQIELPYVPEGDLDDIPASAAAMENWGRYGMNEEQQRKAIAAYYATITFMDEQVGRLLDALDRLDLRKNTIVIFFSDHGFNLGEHNCWQKLSLWEESTRVPLIISAPGFAASAGKSTGALTELIDLYPTIADLAGLGREAPAILQGKSLMPLLENPERADWPREHAYIVTHRRGEALRSERWRYSRWGDEGEELYDLQVDPQEFTNLAGDPAHRSVLQQFRTKLEETRRRSTQ
jgi:iduronate 2-sulfatase